MAAVHVPAAPYPPSQAVFAHAHLSTTEFTTDRDLISEKDAHKLTAMPHCVAFYDSRRFGDPHKGTMSVSACGTQAARQSDGTQPEIQPLGVICDPVLDGAGVHRHPHQLGSVACGIRGMFTITVDSQDLRGAAIGDNIYIALGNQNVQPDVHNSMKGYKLLRYDIRPSVNFSDTKRFGQNKTTPDKLVGRIVSFGPHNEVTVILA